MKNKRQIWYMGYIAALLFVLLIFFTDFSEMTDMGLAVLASVLFGVSHAQLFHNRMMKEDADYKINVRDERNITIKEKAGNIANMANVALLALVTVLFICLDYVIPAIVIGSIIAVQPVILIFASSMLEKKI